MYFWIFPIWFEDDSLKPTTARGEERRARLTSRGLSVGADAARRAESWRVARAMAMACFSSGGDEGILVRIGDRGQTGVPAAEERGDGLDVLLTVPV